MRIFEVSRPTIFRDYIKTIATIKEDVNLKFEPEGLQVLEMDPSRVSMVDLWLPREFFDVWNVDEPFKVCLDLKDVLRVLKKLNKSDSLMTFEYNYDTKIVETAESQNGGCATLSNKKINEKVTLTLRSDIKRKKTIECLEVIEEEVPTPKIYFKSYTRMILSTLKRILDDFKGSSPHFTVKTDSEKIEFSAESDIAHEVTPIERYNDNILDHKIEEDSKAVYTHEGIHDFVKSAVKVSEVAGISLSDDMPMALDIELPQGKMMYYVAPCIGI